MQVNYLDYRFRAPKEGPIWYEKGLGSVFSSNGHDRPHMDYNSLIISIPNLYRPYDNTVMVAYSGHKFMDYFNLLKDWAKNWEGWNDEEAIEPIITKYEGGVTYVEV